MILFQISFTNKTGVFMKFFFYSVVILVQMFFPCYYGSEIEAVSSKITLQLFYSNWIIRDKQFKQNMLILTERSKKPNKLSIIHIYHMNLGLFQTVCSTAYTFFTVLRSILNWKHENCLIPSGNYHFYNFIGLDQLQSQKKNLKIWKMLLPWNF